MAVDEATRAVLLEHARAARRGAYADYSGVSVGAAVLTDQGAVVSGANVENASQTLNCCAERAAIYAAVNGGARRLQAIAVSIGEPHPQRALSPCGACRQVMAEFMDDDAPVFMDGGRDYTVGRLLPDPYRKQR